jgi:hypothetical protein
MVEFVGVALVTVTDARTGRAVIDKLTLASTL